VECRAVAAASRRIVDSRVKADEEGKEVRGGRGVLEVGYGDVPVKGEADRTRDGDGCGNRERGGARGVGMRPLLLLLLLPLLLLLSSLSFSWSMLVLSQEDDDDDDMVSLPGLMGWKIGVSAVSESLGFSKQGDDDGGGSTHCCRCDASCQSRRIDSFPSSM